MSKGIGIFRYQGGWELFAKAFQRLGLSHVFIEKIEDLDSISGLVLHGGESSVQWRYLQQGGYFEKIIQRADEGMPVLGVCAGCILLSRYQSEKVQGMGLLNVNVQRNYYGRQTQSGQVVSDSGNEIMFVRAPGITEIGDEVKVLDTYMGRPVHVNQGSVHGATFHPELGDLSLLQSVFDPKIEEGAELLEFS